MKFEVIYFNINASTTFVARKLGLRNGGTSQKIGGTGEQSVEEIRKHIEILEQKTKRMKSTEIEKKNARSTGSVCILLLKN